MPLAVGKRRGGHDIYSKLSRRDTLFCSVQHGHLHVAQWLFDNGAVRDIRTCAILNTSSMFVACGHGHLSCAKWLFENGAADDVRAPNHDGRELPLTSCMQNRKFEVGPMARRSCRC